MAEVRFGEKAVDRNLVPESDKFPNQIHDLTRTIAQEAGLDSVLRIVEAPAGDEANAFLTHLWSRKPK